MATDGVDPVAALLARAEAAHGTFETTELNGVYDKEWARWYAGYAVDHGIGELIGHAVTTEQLAELLASSFIEFGKAEPEPGETWSAYTARRITAEI